MMKKLFSAIALVAMLASCGGGTKPYTINGTVSIDGIADGDTISLGYSVDGSDLTIDRLIAEKGNKYIDITFGLSEEDSHTIFKASCDMYEADNDFYILANNLDLVYCVTDKKTFSKAGFKSTSNIGEQYIN